MYDNGWFNQSCFHGLRFADYSVPFSHKGHAHEYRPYLVGPVENQAYGKGEDLNNEGLFSYERYESFLCSHYIAGRKYLFRRGLTKNLEADPKEVFEILKPQFPHLPIFREDFDLESEAEQMRWIRYEFDVNNTNSFPNTENIIFQVNFFKCKNFNLSKRPFFGSRF